MYGYTPEYTLYRLSFAQTLALIDTHNEKERKAREAAEEKAAQENNPNYVGNISKYKVDENTPVEELPSLSDLKAAFGAMFGG